MTTTLDKIRPREAHQKALDLRRDSGMAFYELYHDRFFDVDCPACGGNRLRNVFVKYGFGHKKCMDCQTFFTSPRPDDALLAIYYRDYEAPHYWTRILLSTDAVRKAIQHKPRIETILKAFRENCVGRTQLAVDVGAGSGAFALALKNTNYFHRVLALDFEDSCVKACENQGLESFKGSVDNLADDSVDLMTMNDLIEHLGAPLEFVKKCRQVLTPGGMLAIATPNGEGFDIKIMQDQAVNVTPPEHINYFNPYSMRLLLERAGLEILQITTPGVLDVEIVRREIESGRFELAAGGEYLQYLLIDADEEVRGSFQTFLRDNNLSSHMLGLARRPL